MQVFAFLLTTSHFLDIAQVTLNIGEKRMLYTILLVILILLLIGALPAWPYSLGWGYGPSGILGIILIIILILMLTGRG